MVKGISFSKYIHNYRLVIAISVALLLIIGGCADAPPADNTPPASAVIVSNFDSRVEEFGFELFNPNLESVRVHVTLALPSEEEAADDGQTLNAVSYRVGEEIFHPDTGFVVSAAGGANITEVAISNLPLRDYRLRVTTQDLLGNQHSDVFEQISAPYSELHPDLQVTTSRSKASSIERGVGFEITTMVSNIGGTFAAESIVTYYRSANANRSLADEDIIEWSESVVALSAGRSSSSQVITLVAPNDLGIHYYKACVTVVEGEVLTGNNCSVPFVIHVRDHIPSLSLYRLALSADSVHAGESITLTATVENGSITNSAAATLVYYGATGKTSPADRSEYIPLHRVDLDAIPAQGSRDIRHIYTTNHIVYPPTIQKTHFYACVFTTADASSADNCTAVTNVTVHTSPLPDLTVADVVVPGSVSVGETFTLALSVANNAHPSAPATTETTLRYLRSADATITPADEEIGRDTVVAGIDSGGANPHTVSLTAPLTPGFYYYGACVDALTDEVQTANNCSVGHITEVLPLTPPDLAVSVRANSPATVSVGQYIHFNATISNNGQSDSPPNTIRIIQSVDSEITNSDTILRTSSFPSVAGEQAMLHAVSLELPYYIHDVGVTRYYGVCIDEVTDETITENNCSGGISLSVIQKSAEITVTISKRGIAIDDPNISVRLQRGDTIVTTVTVRNNGEIPVASGSAYHYIRPGVFCIPALRDCPPLPNPRSDPGLWWDYRESIPTLMPGEVHEYTISTVISEELDATTIQEYSVCYRYASSCFKNNLYVY